MPLPYVRLFPVCLLFGALGCRSDIGLYSDTESYPDSQPGELDDPTVTDRVVQVNTPQVDVLFVVDNSLSMQDEQDELGRAFPNFLEFFLGSGLDYHIGVTSTDMDTRGDPLQGSLASAAGVRWIDHTMGADQAHQTFVGLVSLGTGGSGDERGLAATYAALELKAETDNAGFLRAGAAIHTVAFSDEDDQSQTMDPELVSKPEFIDWYDGLAEVLEDRTFSSVVCLPSSGGDCDPFDTGDRYMDVTRAIGGITWDIHADAYDELLEELGVQASGFKREYFLTQAPIPESLHVHVERAAGGQVTVIPMVQGPEGVGDYIYDGSRNAIAFHTFVPEPLDEVVITYTLLSSAQDPSYDPVEEVQ